MKDEFRNRLDEILAQVPVPTGCEITYKAVFGAVAAYANGNIFMPCGKFGLALKLPEERCQTMLADGRGSPLKYFEKGHVKRSYVVLSDALIDDRERLNKVIGESINFVAD